MSRGHLSHALLRLHVHHLLLQQCALEAVGAVVVNTATHGRSAARMSVVVHSPDTLLP